MGPLLNNICLILIQIFVFNLIFFEYYQRPVAIKSIGQKRGKTGLVRAGCVQGSMKTENKSCLLFKSLSLLLFYFNLFIRRPIY